MKTRLVEIALLSPALVLLAGCGGEPPARTVAAQPEGMAAEHDHAGENDHDQHTGHSDDDDHVELSAEAAAAAGIRLAKAGTGVVADRLELPAEIRFDADRIARVSPRIGGIVERFHAGEGDVVRRGQALARLSSRDLAGLKAEYLNAESAERLARAELDRETRLWEQKITSEADLQSARAAFEAAGAARRAAENRLHAIGIGHDVLDRLDEAADGALSLNTLTAPIAGQIVRRDAALGEQVAADADALFLIVDDSVVWADIAVYKADLARIEADQPVSLIRADGERVADGVIEVVLPVIDERSRTATARVIVDNAERRLKPGQFVTARIETGESAVVLRVPDDAVVVVEGRTCVFVPSGDGFEPREVTPGATSDGFTEIVSGLSAGEQFVTAGAFTLKAQLEKDAFGDGHAH